MSKATRIVKSITSSDMEKDVMLDLMQDAVGFVFMTTVKVGNIISGTGGTGILGTAVYVIVLLSFFLFLMFMIRL
jgi:lipid-binding SYLF domain-containing protein